MLKLLEHLFRNDDNTFHSCFPSAQISLLFLVIAVAASPIAANAAVEDDDTEEQICAMQIVENMYRW